MTDSTTTSDHLGIALNRLSSVEGGLVDDPDDSGGRTNWGVTERLARRHGYEGDVADMSEERAHEIMRAEFWDPLLLDDVATACPELAYELFDFAVNSGPRRPVRHLQRSLNVLNRNAQDYADVTVDGWMGDETIGAVGELLILRGEEGKTALLRCVDSLQGAFYVELAERRPKDEKFLRGWVLRRVGGY